MNVHISYKAGKVPDVEREFQHQLKKLERRLRVFKPELVHFHAILELQNSHSAKAILNLRLPSGQMAAQKSGESVLAALKNSFTDLLAQVGKHKELLRGNWNWKRRRVQAKGRTAEVAAQQPIAPARKRVQQPAQPVQENGDVASWINANLPRLQRFVDREIRYRVATEQIHEDQISREEVIDEVIVGVLSGEEEIPGDLSLESWLYRLALRAIRQVARANADTANVSLDAPAGVQNVTGSDENALQYHQPDDTLRRENVIRNENVRTPEEIVAGEEMVSQLDFVLHEISPRDREVFVLYALEGFTVGEIARISDLSPDRIRTSIQKARERIQRDLPHQNELRQKILRNSRVA